MSCFLFTDDSDKVQNVNIDELYEKRQQRANDCINATMLRNTARKST